MSNDSDKLGQALYAGALGFGVVATLAPKIFTGLYGLGHDPHLVTMTRLWGTSTTALGVLGLLAAGDEAQASKMAIVGAAVNGVSTVVLVKATPGVSARSRVLGSLSTIAFAAGFGYVIASRD